jgi:hypothetical protein
MASFVKINDFVEHIAEGVHNLGSGTLTVALSNTAPASETSNPTADGNGALANVTQISYTNLSARVITTSSSSQTGGTYSLVLTDLQLDATGAVATFRYVYIFNDSATSPADALIAHYDYGSAVTLANGESFTLDFGANLLTLA